MITNFKIENFRLFNDVEIHKLKKVNLVVGKNSSGKSALLEAFLLYFSKMSIDLLMERLSSRQENWESQQNKYSQQFISNPIRHLFKNHIVPNLDEDGFKFSSKDMSLHVRSAAFVREETDRGITRRKLSVEEIVEYDYDFLDKYLILEENDTSKILFSLDDDYKDIKRRNLRLNKFTSIPCQFVSTSGITDGKASSLWDAISLTDLEKEVVKGIKLIEPEATGITFVENMDAVRDARIPLVKLKNMVEPVPLKSLGDGMTRIFQIILSLVSAKNGVLIVDEFENGLHWSVQDEAWNIVFKLASKLNVQVFCSTHSRDCIDSFENVWKEHKNSANFMRVVKKGGVSTLKEYDLELLSDSLETDVEVR